MGAAQSVLKKILSIPPHRTDRKPPRMFSGRDPDLLAIAEIEHRRRLDAERSLESVFEKVKPILQRKPEPAYLVHALELPADLKTRIAAMPDPEERMRAIVEYKLSTRTQSSHHQ
ncbi:MAG: hypothetical protein ABSG57_13570 [Candidatus Bathyarchaeia archaeon]